MTCCGNHTIDEGDMVAGLGYASYGTVRIIHGPFARVRFGREEVARRLADLTLIAKQTKEEE